jgi:hypothetical protein
MQEELLKLGFVSTQINDGGEYFELDLPKGGTISIQSSEDSDDMDDVDIEITLKNDSGYEFIFQH